MPETETNGNEQRPEAVTTLRAEGVPLLLLTGLVLLVYGRLLMGHILYGADTFPYALGEKAVIWEELLAGHLAAINPYILCGSPALVNINVGVLYPFNLLLLGGSPLQAFHVFVVLHYLMAAWAMYACLRLAFRCPALLAVTGAFAYVAGGHLWSMVDHLFFMAAPWIPLFVLALVRLTAALPARVPRLWVGIAVAALTLLVLCGNFQQAYDTVLLGGVLVLLTAVRHGRSGDWRTGGTVCGLYAVIVGVSVLLAMPQLLPTCLAVAQSHRAGGVPLAEVTAWSFPPFRLVEFLIPFYFGATMGFGHALCSFYNGFFPWTMCVFVGMPLLAGLAFVRLRGSLPLTWAVVVLAIGLLLAVGRYLPVYGLAHAVLPGFAVFRHPEKYLLWVHFSLVLLGTSGLACLCDGICESSRKRTVVLLGLGVVVLLAALPVPLLFLANPDLLAARLRAGGCHWPVGTFVAWQLLQAAGSLAALLVLLVAFGWARRRCQPVLACRGALVVTAVHLVLLSMVVRWTIPATALQTFNPAAALLPPPAHSGLYRIYSDEANSVPVGGPWRETDPFVASELGSHARMTHNAAALFRLHVFQGYAALLGREYVEFTSFRNHDPRRIGLLLAVRYLILPASVNAAELPPGMRILTTNSADGYTIVEDAAALPRIHLAQRHVLVASDKAEAETFRNVRTDLDLTSDTAPAPSAVPPIAVTALPAHFRADIAPLAASRLDVLKLEPGRISAACTGPTWLVVRDWFLPGWRARLDRQPVEITSADAHLMAVFVPPGQHTVDLGYTSPGFVAGCGVAVLGLALGLALIWGAGRWSGRTPAP